MDKNNTQPKKLMIRNSTAEFLMFTADSKEESIEVRFENEMVWLSQKMMAILFNCSIDNISLHLKNIFDEGELFEDLVTEEYSTTATDGKTYKTKHYNLSAVIGAGYRINSDRAISFRKWATDILKEFAIKGYVLDKKRLENGTYLGKDYFDTLLEEIREIRSSERRFYQKITDIYMTALDYDTESTLTRDFFKKVQNKLHYAIHGHTASELIMERADAEKVNMGLTSWKKGPAGKILKSDVTIAKNYLDTEEIKSLDRFVTMYLDYAEDQATKNIPMSMEDWASKLDAFLRFNEREVLDNPGKVSAEIAKEFAEGEFEKYRIVQDRLYESDFDKDVKRVIEGN